MSHQLPRTLDAGITAGLFVLLWGSFYVGSLEIETQARAAVEEQKTRNNHELWQVAIANAVARGAHNEGFSGDDQVQGVEDEYHKLRSLSPDSYP